MFPVLHFTLRTIFAYSHIQNVQVFWASSILHILLLVYDYLSLILPLLVGGLSIDSLRDFLSVSFFRKR